METQELTNVEVIEEENEVFLSKNSFPCHEVTDKENERKIRIISYKKK